MYIDGIVQKIDAVLSLVPNADCVMAENKITIWNNKEAQPTDAEITAEQERLQAEYDAKVWERNRQAAYPKLSEQFDKLWHDINNGTLDNTGEFFTVLKEVKDNNPKPS
jgi:hypothetical protein